MFHVSILCLFLVLATSLPYQLKNSDVSLQIRAFRQKTVLQLTMTIYGAEGQQFSIVSELLSPQHKEHRVSLRDGQIVIFPEIASSSILVRDYANNKYYLAFKHQVGFKQVHFLPLRIFHNNQQNDFFLPSFDMATPFLPEESFYRCDKVLVSLQYKPKQSEKDEELIDIVLFTKDLEEHNFYLGKQWSKIWRHYDDGIYLGGGLKTQNMHEKLLIYLSSSKICQIKLDQLPASGSLKQLHKYHQIEDLLEWVPALPFFINDEL